MKMKMKILILLLGLFLCACGEGEDEDEEIKTNPYITESSDPCTNIPVPADTYVYPIVPGTDEWVELHQKGMDEVLKACQVPAEILQKQCTQAVIETFFDYPFVTDMYTSSSTLLEGFKRSAAYNPAWPELQKRKDAGKCLLERYLLLNPVGCQGAVLLKMPLHEMMLAQPVFYFQLNTDEKKELVKATLDKIGLRIAFDPALVHQNRTACLLIGRVLASARFAPFTREVNRNKTLALYLETQSYEYSDYEAILSFANLFIK
jgi:hypothetical protein